MSIKLNPVRSGCATLDKRINGDLARGKVTSPAAIDFVVSTCPCNTCVKYRIAKRRTVRK